MKKESQSRSRTRTLINDSGQRSERRFPRAAARHCHSRAAWASACRHYDRRARCIAGSATRAGGEPAAFGRVCHEAWPRLSLGMNSPIGTEPWWNAERRARSALRAPHPAGCGGWLRVSRRSASLLSFLTFVARSTDREITGIHRRHSLAKIGAESEEFLLRDDDSGADRIARTEEHAR